MAGSACAQGEAAVMVAHAVRRKLAVQFGMNINTEAHGLDVDNLIVAEAWVGKNLVMKRGRPRARGRFGKIMKPFSELTIKVREREEQA